MKNKILSLLIITLVLPFIGACTPFGLLAGGAATVGLAGVREGGLGGAASDLRIQAYICLLYTSPSPRDLSTSRMPSSA